MSAFPGFFRAPSRAWLPALVAAWPCAAPAQPQLPAVVVTGTREPVPLDRVVADVAVIDADRIRDSGAASVEELLRRVGGIQLSRNGGPGQNAGLMIRGAAANNTVVLIDGVRAGAASLGQFAFEQLSLAPIERIEILRGPGSSLYGADAVGGIVQIFTRRGDGAPGASAHAAVGSRDSREAHAAASGRSGIVDYAVGAAHEASRGVSAVKPGDRFGLHHPDDDGFRRASAQLAGGLTLARGHRVGASLNESRLRSRYDSAEFAPPTFAPDASPDFRNRLAARVASVDYRGTFSPRWSGTVQLAEQRERLASGGATQSRFETHRRQATLQTAWTPTPNHGFVGAFERLIEGVETSAYDPDVRGNSAAVLGYSGRLGRHRLQVDVRGDRRDRDTADRVVLTYKLGWSFQPAPDWTLRAVTGTAFRAPSFNELRFPNYGVPSLLPERSGSFEVGAAWTQGDSSLGATLYRNRVRNLIGTESDPNQCGDAAAYPFGCARNVARARLEGATLTATRRVGDFDFGAVIDFLGARDEASGQRLMRRAAHQETLHAGWRSGDWSAAATLQGVGARPEGGATLAAYRTLDLQLRRRIAPNWRWEARLLNATDRRYEPALDYQVLGRQLFVGVRYDGAGL